MQEVLDKFVDKHFRGACFIAQSAKKATKNDLAEFRFDMANIDTQIVDEYSQVVPQTIYEGATGAADEISPIKGLDLSNSQMYAEFKKMLEDVMRLATITGGVGVD